MKHTVGLAEMVVVQSHEDQIVTHALGSCVGVVVFDPVARVGGILHAMLPLSSIDAEKAQKKPLMFVDTGIPMLFRKAYELGAEKSNLKVYLAGGASVIALGEGDLGIGERNVMVARKLFWKNKILIDAESVGGTSPRTLFLDLQRGLCWFTTHGQAYVLNQGG